MSYTLWHTLQDAAISLCSQECDPQKQFFSEVSVAVGQRVVLPCQSTIEDSDSNLNFFWYRHLPGETLTFLLQAFKASGNDKFRNGRFSVVVYENKTAPLQIATVSFQDTAIYYCAVKHHVKLSLISARAKSASPRTAQEWRGFLCIFQSW
uniref:Ig-like domain-containing protein n=1 Tax=Falco tinnunculus TaxID=100819 RepID=A0A8C4TW34_FALTI